MRLPTILNEVNCRAAVFKALHCALVNAGARPSDRYQDEWVNVPAGWNASPLIRAVCAEYNVSPEAIGFYPDGLATPSRN